MHWSFLLFIILRAGCDTVCQGWREGLSPMVSSKLVCRNCVGYGFLSRTLGRLLLGSPSPRPVPQYLKLILTQYDLPDINVLYCSCVNNNKKHYITRHILGGGGTKKIPVSSLTTICTQCYCQLQPSPLFFYSCVITIIESTNFSNSKHYRIRLSVEVIQLVSDSKMRSRWERLTFIYKLLNNVEYRDCGDVVDWAEF